MKARGALSLTAAAVALTVTVQAPAGAAVPTPDPSPTTSVSAARAEETNFTSVDDADLAGKIDKHIARYGGQRRGANQIVWSDKGAVMTFPTPVKATARTAYARIACGYGDYCLYQHALWDREGGAMIAFYEYGLHQLADFGWQDITSALENNQSDRAGGAIYDDATTLNRSRAWYKADALGSGNDRADIAYLFP
ncbi:hypothetical protein ABZ470_38860 [Streptosporangium sp. NPDC020072]|uniref:hypothetical protein n=1 Tax=Streptosporangium sp. NPDC020072 TaxID=3154788 RepID=UPI0034266A62